MTHRLIPVMITASILGVAAAPASGSAAAPAAAVPTMTVDVSAGRHMISRLVYGMNSPDAALATELGLPARRWGGNATSRYNWQNNTTNVGSDWYFENIVGSASSSLDAFVRANRARATTSIVTVPMTGWVAKNSSAAHPYTCAFPRASYPAQDSYDPWDAGCGNGLSGGRTLTPGAATRTSLAAGPAFVTSMVRHLVSTHGDAAHGGVAVYELDNEPTLWNSTHRDVHPTALGYEELKAKSLATAAAVKAGDPTALVLGPSDWGWCAYFYSAVDRCGGSPTDHDAHGADLAPWYLRQFKSYADAHPGTRLLDYLDEHYYPEAAGVALAPAGNATTQALRLRSTRSLWDPTYVDESWIGTDVKAPPIQLIRRMKAWAAKEYPGTRTAITEYNFGGLESMNGALAQADVLGVFGREGLGLAALWGPPSSGQPGAFAFRIYRNYDGAGSRFGDVSVSATSADSGALAVYAAQRSSDGALTVVVVNKSASALTWRTTLAGFTPTGSAARYTYSTAALSRIVPGPAVPVGPGGWNLTYPATSITLLVLPRA
jgi:hypothetical protein